ncbi:MAG: outer membrane beta-barrel protein [Bacteroidales bacterium]|nr:outer membrane beta-barrel protein [Bacteroidales bacterium]
MKKSFLFIVIFLMTASAVFSQVNYKPGYIVTPKNDTIKGFINKYWDNNPSTIHFKESMNAKSKEYKPADIAGFAVDGKNYVSAVNVPTLNDAREFLNNVGYGSNPELVTKSTFLVTLIDGSKSLYYYDNDQNIESFYIKEDGKFHLLVFKKYMKIDTVNSNPVKSLNYNKRYIGQLISYLSACPKIKSSINNVGYHSNELINLFDKYYKCTSTKPTFGEKTSHATTRLGIYAGLGFTSFTFKTPDFAYISAANFKEQPGFALGAAFDVLLPVNYGKFIWHNELGYSYMGATGNYTKFSDNTDYTIVDYKLALQQVNLNTMIRFNFQASPNTMFFNMGMTFNYLLASTNYSKVTEKTFNHPVETVTEDKAIPELNSMSYGFLAGLGYQFKNYGTELRYTFITNASHYSYIQARPNIFSFVFTYNFK